MSNPTQDQAKALAELERIERELRYYSPAADAHGGKYIHKGWSSALEGVRAALSQPTAAQPLSDESRDAARYRCLRQFNVDSYLACGKEEALDAQIDALIASQGTASQEPTT